MQLKSRSSSLAHRPKPSENSSQKISTLETVETYRPGRAWCFGTVLIITLLIVTLWVHNVRSDRKHIVLAKSETPIFAGAGNESCGGPRLTVVRSGTTPRVQRLRYWKSCAIVNIVLSDG
jgi:hypothetical protein